MRVAELSVELHNAGDEELGRQIAMAAEKDEKAIAPPNVDFEAASVDGDGPRLEALVRLGSPAGLLKSGKTLKDPGQPPATIRDCAHICAPGTPSLGAKVVPTSRAGGHGGKSGISLLSWAAESASQGRQHDKRGLPDWRPCLFWRARDQP
jgi:hypothetical protein